MKKKVYISTIIEIEYDDESYKAIQELVDISKNVQFKEGKDGVKITDSTPMEISLYKSTLEERFLDMESDDD